MPSAVAREVGRSPATITRYMKQERTVGAEDAERIASFFRLPLHMIFTEVDR